MCETDWNPYMRSEKRADVAIRTDVVVMLRGTTAPPPLSVEYPSLEEGTETEKRIEEERVKNGPPMISSRSFKLTWNVAVKGQKRR